MLSNRCMEREQREASRSPLNTSCPLWSSLVFSLSLSHQCSVLFLCCCFIAPSLYYSLSAHIARGPCYATLLMTILLIGATEAAVRDASHALKRATRTLGSNLKEKREQKWRDIQTEGSIQHTLHFMISNLSTWAKYIILTWWFCDGN